MRPVNPQDSTVNGFPLSRSEGWDLLDMSRAKRSATELDCLLVPLKAPMVGVIVEVRPRRPSIAKRDRGAWYWMPWRPGWAWVQATRAVFLGGGSVERARGQGSLRPTLSHGLWRPLHDGKPIPLGPSQRRTLSNPIAAMKVVEAVAERAGATHAA